FSPGAGFSRSRPNQIRLYSASGLSATAPAKAGAYREHPTSAVEVVDLHKTYTSLRRTSPALSGVSFSVEPGTIFGLIGQNGAGKTTLVKILMGLCKPTAGSARILGCSSGDPIANRLIGYI